MKTMILAAFALGMILTQTACSDDQAAQYAAANNCTIGGANATSVTAASQAASAQVPCSFRSATTALADASSVAASQVGVGTATPVTAVISDADLQKAVLAKSVSVKEELTKLGAPDPAVAKSESIEVSRAPSSLAAPVVEGSTGIGEAMR